LRNIYLHIGLFKTATKYLQRNVFPFMKGYRYIRRREYEKTLLKRIIFSDYMVFRREVGDIRRRFIRLMGDHENIILSHELFSGNPMFQSFDRYILALKMKDIFLHPKIIIGIRGQKYIIDSLYREYIAQGGTKRFEEFTYNRNSLPKSILSYDAHLDLKTLRYGDYLDFLCECFGKDNLYIFPYEKIQKKEESFIEDLCRFMSVNRDECRFNQTKTHESLGDLQLHKGVIPYKYNPRNLLRKTNIFYYKRSIRFQNQINYTEDNDYIDKKYKLGLRKEFYKAYFE